MSIKIFLTSSVNFVASDIAKKLGGVKNKKIFYIYTACEQKRGSAWQIANRNSLVKVGFKVVDYTITGKSVATIKKDFKNTDALYVEGGSSLYLLQQIQLTKSAPLFKQAVKDGKIYIGTSAGSMVAGASVEPSYILGKINTAPKLKGFKGLGLADFCILPHWGSEKHREEYFSQKLVHNYNTKNKLILLNDYQYMEVEDGWYRMVEVKHKN
jgi:dipeptidase E